MNGIDEDKKATEVAQEATEPALTEFVSEETPTVLAIEHVERLVYQMYESFSNAFAEMVQMQQRTINMLEAEQKRREGGIFKRVYYALFGG